MDLERALALLYRRNIHTVKLGLEPVRALLDELGRPQDSFLSIHVAGTNGKGSTCAMLASILNAAGLRTGLYTSPHLIRFNERINVSGEPISDEALGELLPAVENAAAAAAARTGERDVTFFEFTTALAFEHFRRRKVQVAVVETGMGGRLDATNVLEPLLCAITSIGLDHAEHLGETIEAIAAEKAGIIKPSRAVVVGDVSPEALAVIRETAARQGSEVLVARDAVTVSRKIQTLVGQRIKIETSDSHFGPLTLPLAGPHQLGNAAVVVAAIERLRDEFQLPIPHEAVSKGLEETRWPARFQAVSMDPPTIIDGAHNEEAARVLGRTLHDLSEGRPLALVFGFLREKNAPAFLRELASRVKVSWAVPVHNPRAMPLDEVISAARQCGLEPKPMNLKQAIREAQAWAREHGGIVCVTGSLYLAGEALQILRD